MGFPRCPSRALHLSFLRGNQGGTAQPAAVGRLCSLAATLAGCAQSALCSESLSLSSWTAGAARSVGSCRACTSCWREHKTSQWSASLLTTRGCLSGAQRDPKVQTVHLGGSP